tara:strand:- start:1835 stop:2143 length:309 start_codon:yes stop_codon:yes gene_type:complete
MSRRRSSHNFKLIQKHQQTLDEANPFLVEILDGKTDEELHEFAMANEAKYEIAMQSSNHNTRLEATKHRDTIMAAIEVRRLTKLLDKIANEEESGTGGFSLS